MKRFLFVLATFPLLALGACTYHLYTRTVPAIAVSIQDESSGGTNYLPAVEGYVGHGGSTHFEDTKEIYHAGESYKVVSNTEGHFFVLAHYIIVREGVSTEVDQTLPVWEKTSAKMKWAKLDDHLTAFAYLSETKLYY